MILFSVTSIFSFSTPYILLSDNFECGFYPILIEMLKYKLNYWILTIYFLIFEQEFSKYISYYSANVNFTLKYPYTTIIFMFNAVKGVI